MSASRSGTPLEREKIGFVVRSVASPDGGDEILREIWRFLARTTMPRKPGGPCQAPPASSLSYPGGQMRYGSLSPVASAALISYHGVEVMSASRSGTPLERK